MSEILDESDFSSGSIIDKKKLVEPSDTYYQFREVGHNASVHWNNWNFCTKSVYDYYNYRYIFSESIETRMLKPV